MITLPEKDQNLIDELKEHSHYDAITYCSDEVPRLLDIITRYQKALEMAEYYMEIISKQPGEGHAKRLFVAGQDKIKQILDVKINQK